MITVNKYIKSPTKNYVFTVYLCVVYNPPAVSTYSQNQELDIIQCIEKDVHEYMKYGDILLCGDFNSRVSNEDDFIDDDSNQFLPVSNTYLVDKPVLQRENQDDKIDKKGKDLLDFCISSQIRLLNGRIFGDCYGKFTCYTPNGASVVDYVMASESLLENILYFHVNDFIPTISDCHCLLEWELSADYSVQQLLIQTCLPSPLTLFGLRIQPLNFRHPSHPLK